MGAWNSLTRKKLRQSTSRGQDASTASSDLRAIFTGLCCGGNSKEFPSSSCALDRGLQIFANLVETRMREYETATSPVLDALWNTTHPQLTYLDRQMETATRIVRILTAATPQTTVDDIVNDVFQHFAVREDAARRHRNSMRHLVFAVMGWCTMLYTPTVVDIDADYCVLTLPPSGQPVVAPTKQSFEQSSRRPIGAVLRSYGLMPIACPPGSGPTLPGLPPLLTVTHLNFYSLSRLGDVTIRWVDDLSQHCEFDRYSINKELKLFRLPSLCARISLDEDTEVLVGR